MCFCTFAILCSVVVYFDQFLGASHSKADGKLFPFPYFCSALPPNYSCTSPVCLCVHLFVQPWHQRDFANIHPPVCALLWHQRDYEPTPYPVSRGTCSTCLEASCKLIFLSEIKKKDGKRNVYVKNIFLPAFGCASIQKAGQNIQHSILQLNLKALFDQTREISFVI